MPLLGNAQKITLGTTVTRDGGEYSGEMVAGTREYLDPWYDLSFLIKS